MIKDTPQAFFAMPSTALKSLFDEIRLSVEPNVAEEIIYRYGMRCGEGVIRQIGVKPASLEEFSNMLDSLWAHVGLGRPKAQFISRTQVQVEVRDSVEALAKGGSDATGCAFSSGYLAGLASEAMGARFTVEEIECIASGSRRCLHMISLEDPGPPDDLGASSPAAHPPERTPASRAMEHLERGYSYLVVDEVQATAFNIFKDLVSGEFDGFCITRTFPDKVRDTYGLDVPMLWLTMEEGENTLVPHNVAKLNFIIDDFIKRAESSVVLLEGLEYLITHNTYETILRFLQLINDRVALTNSILIIPINPDTLDRKRLKLLEREMRCYRPDE